MRIAVLIFLVLAALFLGIGVWMLTMAFASNSWPAVEGEVASTHVVGRLTQAQSATQRRLEYIVEVTYEYEVDGRSYRARRFSLGTGQTVAGGFSEKTAARAWLAESEYQKGRPVQVYVDPNDPENTVLYTGVLWSTWVPVVISLLMLGLAMAGHFYTPPKAKPSGTS